jgi:hypothetical protein
VSQRLVGPSSNLLVLNDIISTISMQKVPIERILHKNRSSMRVTQCGTPEGGKKVTL